MDGVVEHCPVFKLVDPTAQAGCAIQASQDAIHADFKAMATTLPGNNPIQLGPHEATHPDSAATVTPIPTLPSNLVPTSQSVPPRTSNSADLYSNQFQQSSVTPTSSADPAVTPAPVASKLPDGEKILNTMFYTSNGAVYEVVNVEIVSTTTVWNHVPRNAEVDGDTRHLRRHAKHQR